MAIEIEPKRTTYSQKEMIIGFIEGWFKQFKEVPKKESIGVIFAQNFHESGATKSMWMNNIGNFKYAKTPDDDNVKYMKLSGVWEIINNKKIILDKENPGAWFLAFDSLKDGIAFHLDHLKNKRYKSSWSAIENGDPKEFAHLLKVKKYYTAAEEDYYKGMKYYFDLYMKDSTFDDYMKTKITNPWEIVGNLENE